MTKIHTTENGIGSAPSGVYEPPALVDLGSLHELTLGCDKMYGASDGYTWHGDSIVCASP